jgi:hypothetical protein
LLFFLAAPGSPAQERRLDLGLGLEGNMNTLYRASASSWFSASLALGRYFGTGVKTGYSHNFSGTGTLEMAALGRWYFLSMKNEKSRLFVQVEAGADLIFYEQKTLPAVLGGLAAGWRFNLGRWYLEPVIRGGYPYIWGGGIGFGYRI